MNPLGKFTAVADRQPQPASRTIHGWRLWAHYEAKRKGKKDRCWYVPSFGYLASHDIILINFNQY